MADQLLNPNAVIGDNHPPEELTPFQQLEKRKDELFAGINRFVKDNPVLESQDMIDKVSDFKAQLSALAQDTERQRKAEKQPHLDAGRAVDEKYGRLGEILSIGLKKVVVRLTDAMKAMNAKRDEERRKAQEELDRKQREADEAKRQAEKLNMMAEDGALPANADLMGTEQKALDLEAVAEAQQKEVRVLQGNVKGGTGEVDGKKKSVALHTFHTAKITDGKAALNYFWANKETRPKLLDVLDQLANAAVKKCMAANDPDSVPPGVEVVTDQRAQ